MQTIENNASATVQALSKEEKAKLKAEMKQAIKETEAQQSGGNPPEKPADIMLSLPGKRKVKLDLLQKRVNDLSSKGGILKGIAASNQALLSSVSAGRAKADMDGSLIKIPGRETLKAMLSASLITKEEHARQLALIGFVEALDKLLNA